MPCAAFKATEKPTLGKDGPSPMASNERLPLPQARRGSAYQIPQGTGVIVAQECAQ